MEAMGLVGGDRRTLFCARALREEGRPVFVLGLEKLEGVGEFPRLGLEELAAWCPVVVLPLPATRDGKLLNAPYAQEPLAVTGELPRLLRGHLVLGGMAGALKAAAPLWEEVSLVDYSQREEFALGNAFLTAEGAVALAIESSPGSLGGARCLVTGFGRIGKALCLALRGMGAQVDCAARKPRDWTAIRALGCGPLSYGSLGGPYDYIFNTVPAPVLGEEALSRQGPDTLLLELASAPGGICRPAAEALGLRVVDGPSLPGRYAPQASGRLMKEAVTHILEERRMQP